MNHWENQPSAIDYLAAFQFSAGLGAVEGVLKALGDMVIDLVQAAAPNILLDGWSKIAFALIRLALFIQDLAKCSSEYQVGYQANEFGTLVSGLLQIVAQSQYTARVIVPSITQQLQSAGPEAATMYEELRMIYKLQLDSTVHATVSWVKHNVSNVPLFLRYMLKSFSLLGIRAHSRLPCVDR